MTVQNRDEAFESFSETTRYRSVQDVVLETISQRLVNGSYPPGQKLAVRELSKQLDVSAAPVREALMQLTAEGLVDFRPRYGFYARKLTPDDLAEIFEIRRWLEQLALARSITRLTREELATLADCVERLETAASHDDWLKWNRTFHFTLYGSCDYPRLMGMIRTLWDSIEAYLRLYLSWVGKPVEAQADHWKMLSAARKGRVEELQEVLATHLRRTCDKLLEHMQTSRTNVKGRGYSR